MQRGFDGFEVLPSSNAALAQEGKLLTRYAGFAFLGQNGTSTFPPLVKQVYL